MRRAYNDFTSDMAVKKANEEYREMARLAVRIRENRCSSARADELIPRFTGIFSRLLTDPIEQVKTEAR